MNSLERARRFVARSAGKIALTIVPLAALSVAPAAHAGPLQFGEGACGGSVDGNSSHLSGSCHVNQISESGSIPTTNWIGVSGYVVNFANIGSGSYTLTVNGGGSTVGDFAGTLPVAWDFYLRGDQGAAIDYTIDFALVDDSGSTHFSTAGSGFANDHLSGFNFLQYTGTPLSYTFALTATNDGTSSYAGFDIPGATTLDFNPSFVDAPTDESGVPEPSSLVMAGTGLAASLFGFIRRRRKA